MESNQALISPWLAVSQPFGLSYFLFDGRTFVPSPVAAKAAVTRIVMVDVWIGGLLKHSLPLGMTVTTWRTLIHMHDVPMFR